MKAITVLDKSVYNLIAAGEVIERPASVVKELVENAIDAGAKAISVTVENGGMSLIEVSDDGCGIAPEDVKKAFLAHATSKVAYADDLFKIGTLGFRGEALPSVAAVSKVTLKTAVEGKDGTEISLSQGVVESCGSVGCKRGTTVSVKDLFFNVPARRNFLKKPSSEAVEIASVLQRLALTAPTVSFELTSNGVKTLHTQGLGLASAVFAVYGKDCLEQCLKVDWIYKDIEVSGFCGKPEFLKANRSYQTLIVNGRYVKNMTVESAAKRAYEKFITNRSFPFFVLNVNLPLDKIDVNVHPNKLDVRFSDPNDIFVAVYSALTNALTPEWQNPPEIIKAKEAGKAAAVIFSKESGFVNLNEAANDFRSSDKAAVAGIDELVNDSAAAAFAARIESDALFDNLSVLPLRNPDFLSDAFNESQSTKVLDCDFLKTKNVGKLFETYLLLESGNIVFIIDQHAAHEMLLYKEFCDKFESQKLSKQDMLVPFVFTLSSVESEFFALNSEVFSKQGFEMEPFGKNTFKINSVPMVLSQINLRKFVDSVLGELDCIAPREKFAHEYLARKACSAAVKAGEQLSEAEIDSLKKELAASENLRCPHGRPVAVKVSKSEIEKWFNRLR